jgi:hypothetical protein
MPPDDQLGWQFVYPGGMSFELKMYVAPSDPVQEICGTVVGGAAGGTVAGGAAGGDAALAGPDAPAAEVAWSAGHAPDCGDPSGFNGT